MDYAVTVPKTVDWQWYLKEIDTARENKLSLFFRIPYKVDVRYNESRCFIVHNGAIRGWMTILTCIENPIGFTCFYTGKKWPPGTYIERRPRFNSIDPIPMKGFRGIRKVEVS